MNKSNPKMILNVTIDNPEFEEKVKIAMNEYAENVILKNLDTAIQTLINRRIQRLINGSWSDDGKINGKTFEQYVREKTEAALDEAIGKNIKEILARKITEII